MHSFYLCSGHSVDHKEPSISSLSEIGHEAIFYQSGLEFKLFPQISILRSSAVDIVYGLEDVVKLKSEIGVILGRVENKCALEELKHIENICGLAILTDSLLGVRNSDDQNDI